MKKYAFGIDIGGTTIKMGLFENDGKLSGTREIPTKTESGGRYILDDIAKAIEESMAERRITSEEIVGIGVGVPGPVDSDGTVLKCVNLGWNIFNVEDALSEKTGFRVKAGNDANVAALGEMWQGGGRGFKNIIMVTLGTGVGGGVVIDEKILYGSTGAAGEIGHFPVAEGEMDHCGCGKRGCLEQYASANGIARLAGNYLCENKAAVSVLREYPKITAKEVFDAARGGDETAFMLVDTAAKMLGRACAYMSCLINPEAFVIGGGMAKAGRILTDAIRRYYKEYAFHASKDTDFRLAKLSNDAGIFGSVKMVLQ